MVTPALDASVVITRPAGLSLVIADAPFVLLAVGPGQREWERRAVEGRYQHGRALLDARLRTPTLIVQVRCTGSSWLDIVARYDELLAAVSEFSVDVTVTVEGRVDAYSCELGDVFPIAGDTLDAAMAAGRAQEYELRLPIRL